MLEWSPSRKGYLSVLSAAQFLVSTFGVADSFAFVFYC